MDATTIAVATILIWIGNHTDYNIHIPWPTVAYMDKAAMQKYGESPCKSEDKDDVVGLYFDGERKVVLTEGTDIRTPEGESTLFHEVFHHVQNLNEKKAPELVNDREKEDYGFENRWRKEHHLKQEYVPDLSTRKEKC